MFAVVLFLIGAGTPLGTNAVATTAAVLPMAALVQAKGTIHPLCNPTVATNTSFTVKNTLASGTGAYEQFINFTPSILGPSLNTTMNNWEVIYPNGTAIQAWMEAGATKTSTNTEVWLRLFNIAATTTQTLYLNTLTGCSSTTMSGVNGPMGEAPQLSGSYAQFDNGWKVFLTFYDNFSGHALKSIWTNATGTQGGNAINDNGLTLTVASSASAKPQIYSTTNFTRPNNIEWYGAMTGTCTSHAVFGMGWPLINAANNVESPFCVNTNSGKWCDISAAGAFTCGAAGSTKTYTLEHSINGNSTSTKACFWEGGSAVEGGQAEGCSSEHAGWNMHVTASGQAGSGSITADWVRIRSDNITASTVVNGLTHISGYVYSVKNGVQVPDSGANITLIPTVVGSRGTQVWATSNATGYYSIVASPSVPDTVYTNRSAGFGGDYASFTTAGVHTANLLQWPYRPYNNKTFTLPAWNKTAGRTSNCNQVVPCMTGSGVPAPAYGYQQPVVAWTSDSIYYVNATGRLVSYSLINGTVRNIAGWPNLYTNIMNYNGVENYFWLTQDDNYAYAMGCLGQTCTINGNSGTITSFAVNVSTGRTFWHNWTGLTIANVEGNGGMYMIGLNSNESEMVIVTATNHAFGYNIWNTTQWSFATTIAPFEANNIWWIPSINSFIDVTAGGTTTDDVIQYQLGGAGSGTTFTNASFAKWANGNGIGGSFLGDYNITDHTFVATEATAGYTYAQQIVKLSAGTTGTITGFGTKWALTNVGGNYPNNTVLTPLVTGSSQRVVTLSSGPTWAFLTNNFFQNNSEIVDPKTSTWYDTNLTWVHNQTTAGCTGTCYIQREGQVFPSADEGLFYNTTYSIEPVSYDCRVNASSCATDNAGTLGRIYWVWKTGTPEFPYPATAYPGQPCVPSAIQSIGSAVTAATSEKITWAAPANCANPIMNYTLFWGTTSNALNHKVDLFNYNNSFTINGLVQGTTYYYQIEAWNLHWYNKMASLSFTAGSVPGAPTGLTATTTSTTQINTAWTNAAGGGTNDTVWQWSSATVCTGAYTTSYSTAGVATSQSVTGLAAGTAYAFEVSEWNVVGNSALSSCVTNTTIPNAPTSLSVSSTTTTSVSLSWTNPAPTTWLTDDKVFWKQGFSCASGTTTQDLGSAGTSATVSGLTTDTAYCFYVIAYTLGGGSSQSSTVEGVTNTVPGQVTGLSATGVTLSRIQLTWINPTGGGIVNDTVWRWNAASCAGAYSSTNSTGGSATTFTIGGLTSATNYSFEVSAWNATGNGPLSSCLTKETLPNPATALGANGITTTTVPLTWSNPAGGLYNDTVYRWTGSTCTGSYAQSYSAGIATSYTVTGLSAATAYSFKVQVWDASGNSSLTVCTGETTFPGAVTGLTIGTVTTGSIQLTWTDPAGTLVNNTVYYGTTCASATGHSTAGVATSFTASGLAWATKYCFKVSAWSAGGQGALVWINATTLPGAATGLSVTGIAPGVSVTLSWTNPNGTIANDTILAGTVCGTWTVRQSTGGAATSGTVSGLTNLTTYCFTIQVWSAGGSGATSTTITDQPPAPTSLHSTGVAASTITVAWTPSAATTVFQSTVYYGITCAFGSTLVINSATPSGTITGLSITTTYCIAVADQGFAGYSPKSTFINATTTAAPFNPPSIPISLHVVTQTTNSITLAWTPGTPAPTSPTVNYTIWFGLNCTPSNSQSLGGVGNTGLVTGLQTAATYCFEVQSWSQNGQGSNLSSTAIGTTASGGGGGGGGVCPGSCPAINNTTVGLNGRAVSQYGFYLIILGVITLIAIGAGLLSSYTPPPNKRVR